MADDVTTTAGEGGHTDRHTSGPTSQEGRTSDANGFSLPTRRSYFTTLSTVAFVSGLGIAALVTIRRGRRMHLEDLRAAETAGQHARPSTMRSSPTVTPNVRDESPLGQASSSGVIALFKEMNRAAFSRKKGHPSQEDVSPSQAPSILQRHAVKAKAPPQSVFESSVSTPPPSVLMRASKHEQSSVRSSVELTQEAVRSTSIADQLRDAREAMNEDSPVLLAIKAIGLATAIVGAATWVVVEVACLVMQVKSVSGAKSSMAWRNSSETVSFPCRWTSLWRSSPPLCRPASEAVRHSVRSANRHGKS